MMISRNLFRLFALFRCLVSSVLILSGLIGKMELKCELRDRAKPQHCVVASHRKYDVAQKYNATTQRKNFIACAIVVASEIYTMRCVVA